MKYVKYFLVLFVLFSWITHPIGGSFSGGSISNPIQRMTFSDLMGFAGVVVFLIVILNQRINVPKIFQLGLVFLVLLLPGIITSYKPYSTFFEIFILSFLLLVGISLFNIYKDEKGLIDFIKIVTLAAICAAGVGLYDLIAGNLGFPMFFNPRAYENPSTGVITSLVGEAKSGFRNAGQAGSYVLHMLTIILPLSFSSLFNYFTPIWRRIIHVAIFFTISFLLATFKVASLIGLLIGAVMFLILRREGKFIFYGLVFTLLVASFFPITETFAPNFYNRVQNKFATRVLAYTINNQDVEDNVQQGFIKKNLGLAMLSFKDNPITGSGIGGFSGRYMKYEVHSTPFKVLGETGLLGVLGYTLFMTSLLLLFINAYRLKGYNPFRSFLINMFPFFIGCLVSWGYTWHMRKRSFWIMLVVISLSYYLMYECQRKQARIDE